jgi:hypothetical protein
MMMIMHNLNFFMSRKRTLCSSSRSLGFRAHFVLVVSDVDVSVGDGEEFDKETALAPLGKEEEPGTSADKISKLRGSVMGGNKTITCH